MSFLFSMDRTARFSAMYQEPLNACAQALKSVDLNQPLGNGPANIRS